MNNQRLATVRTRWAAVGAAVAVTLGAGGLSFVNAAGDDAQSYEAIAPCRLADTRNGADNVGDRAAPLGADETFTLDGWGAHGNCTLPNDTAALALNVTALNATSGTFLQFFPAGGAKPEKGSSLNPAPNQPPTPNAVTVTLSNTGEFSIYNKAGSVDVIIDVVGVFSDVGQFTGAVIADESLTGADIMDGSINSADIEDESITGADVDDHSLSSKDIQNEAGLTTSYKEANFAPTATPSVASSVTIRPPANGYVTIEVTANVVPAGASLDAMTCQITTSTDEIDFDEPTMLYSDFDSPVSFTAMTFSGHRTFTVEPGLLNGTTYNLVCDETNGSISMFDMVMTATYVPSNYSPLIFTIPTFIIIGP